MTNSSQKKQAYTLTEIMTVIIVIGAILALAIPRYNHMMARIKNREGEQILWQIYGAQLDFNRDNAGDTYASGLAATVLADYLDLPTDLKGFFFIAALNRQDLSAYTGCPALNSVGQVSSVNLDFHLSVTEDGQIACWTNTGGCDAEVCRKMGYNPNPPPAVPKT